MPPLSDDELGALLQRALEGPVTPAARDELARLSGGNLQVLAELIRGARERGVLVPGDDGWRLTAPLPTTAALEELVAETLADVDAAGLEVLELLAVCERFGVHDLERRHGAATLERLEAARLVTVVTAGRRTAVRLSHPLYGEVLRAGLPPLRLRRIQQQLADVVEAHGARRREDAVQVALWRLGSGGDVSDERLLGAARLALVGRDPTLAIRLLEATADTGDRAAGERAEALAEAHAMLGHDDEVDRVIADVWERDLPDAVRAGLARRRAETRFYGGRDLAGALAVHEDARARMRDPEAVAAVDARRATLLAGAGRPSEALRVADAVGAVASPRTRLDLAAARATSLLSLGRCDEAAALSAQAAADQGDLPGWLARRGIALHVLNQGHALAYSGRYAEASALLAPAAERARSTNTLAAWVWFEMARAEIARDTGRADEAIARFAAVAGIAPAAGQEAALVWALVGVVQGHLLKGECTKAAEAMARADAVDSPVATSVATRERTRAWLEACRGDLVSARARIRDVAAQVRADEVFIFEAGLLNDLVRLGAADEAVVARLAQLADVIDGPLVQAHARHAAAVAGGDADLLEEVVDRYEAIGALALAAEGAAELADLRRAAGEVRRGTAAQQRSAELAARAGGVRTPTLARGSGLDPLTGREREVALLAAAGRTSREIGAHLFLSTRTVDTHLARVYRKLGIGGRTELAAALGIDAET